MTPRPPISPLFPYAPLSRPPPLPEPLPPAVPSASALGRSCTRIVARPGSGSRNDSGAAAPKRRGGRNGGREGFREGGGSGEGGVGEEGRYRGSRCHLKKKSTTAGVKSGRKIST